MWRAALRLLENPMTAYGASLTVTPAADLIKCPHYDVPKFIIDPCEPFDPYDDNYPEGYEHIRKNATEGVDVFMERLLEL